MNLVAVFSFEKTVYVPEKRNAFRDVINKCLENIFKSEYQ